MLSTTKTFLSVTLVSLSLAACSGSGVTEDDFAALKASMEACSESAENTDPDNFAVAMENIKNNMECTMKTGDDFFLQHCGEEKVFSNISGAAVKKAMSAAMSPDMENGKLTSEEVQALAGECAAEVWQQMEAMSAKEEAAS